MSYKTIVKVSLDRYVINHIDEYRGDVNRVTYIRWLIEQDLRMKAMDKKLHDNSTKTKQSIEIYELKKKLGEFEGMTDKEIIEKMKEYE